MAKDKAIRDMHNMQLSDHFTISSATLVMECTSSNFENTLENTKKLDSESNSTRLQNGSEDAVIEKHMKKTQAWIDEEDIGENLYELEGKKMNLYPRKLSTSGLQRKISNSGVQRRLSNSGPQRKDSKNDNPYPSQQTDEEVGENFVIEIGDVEQKAGEERPQSTPTSPNLLSLSGYQLTIKTNGKSIRTKHSPRVASLRASRASSIDEQTLDNLSSQSSMEASEAPTWRQVSYQSPKDSQEENLDHIDLNEEFEQLPYSDAEDRRASLPT